MTPKHMTANQRGPRSTQAVTLRSRWWPARGGISERSGWLLLVMVPALLAMLPIISVLFAALGPSEGTWWHLWQYVLPGAIWQTLLVLCGVGGLTLVVGTGCAWLVTMCRFPGRTVFSWLLLLPLAVPTYITAYAYVEMFDYVGPVQSLLRAAMGWQSASEYWFFDLRSLPGAVFILSAALYPYVFLTARASFLAQSYSILDVSRTLGHTRSASFWRIALPMARPAIAAGLMLVLMECLNDIGAVEYLGVRTVTVVIYDVWLGRGSLTDAARLACFGLSVVFLLALLERYSRRRARFYVAGDHYRALPNYRLSPLRAALAFLACVATIIAGFIIPVAIMLSYSWPRWHVLDIGHYLALMTNSLLLAAIVALSTTMVGVILAYAQRQSGGAFVGGLTRFAAIGYALPGTILAIGVLIPLAALDNWIASWAWLVGSERLGLLFSGSLFALALALTLRFTALSYGTVDAGLSKLSPNLGLAARNLGRSAGQTMLTVDLPMIRPAVMIALLLVFVDTMKELPASLLLRPFGFETLATHVYAYASAERFEDAAIAALSIIVAGILPVVVLAQQSQHAFRQRINRRGSRSV